MIANIKVTDGDLLLVNLSGGNVSHYDIDAIRKSLIEWCKSKGLQNVKILVSGGDVNIDITKITVNDAFEEEVLKK